MNKVTSFIKWHSFLVFIFFLSHAYAETFTDLFEVTISTDSEAYTNLDENSFIEIALDTLLLRITGRDNLHLVADYDSLRPYQNLVLQRGYIEDERYLVAFIEESIRTFLRANNINFWGQERPQIGLIAVSSEGRTLQEANFLDPSVEYFNELNSMIEADAYQRGIFINYILTDEFSITANDIIFFNFNALQDIMESQDLDYLVFLNIQSLYFEDRFFWYLLDKNSGVRKIEANALSDGIPNIASYLASIYAFPDYTENIEITVAGIYSMEDYNRLRQRLRDLSIIENIQFRSLINDNVNLRLDVTGGAEAFSKIISIENLFVSSGDTLIFQNIP